MNPTEAESHAVPTPCGVIEIGWRGVIEMTGRDRVRFLHGMCTNDIKGLQPGQGCMAAVVNRQGRMVSEIVVRATEKALLIETDRSNLQNTIDSLGRFIVADDVSMRPAEIVLIEVFGPGAKALLGQVDLPSFHFIGRGEALVSPSPVLGPGGFVLLTPAVSASHELQRLAVAGARLITEATYESLRIENGFPRWGADMGPEVLPMEAGLEPLAISYTKGCYIGQEVIQRVKTYSEPPKTLVSLVMDDATVPRPRSAIKADDLDVGHVTSAAPSPSSGRGIALGYIRKEVKAPGTRVMVGARPATVLGLRWHGKA